jgi:putative membrane protein
MRHPAPPWKPRAFALAVLSLAPLACDDSTPPATPRDAPVDADDASAADVAPTDGDSDAQAPAPFADGQVVAALEAVDFGEISLGQLAMSQAADPRVRDFGAAMVAMHTTASERVIAVRRRVGITPAESDLSRMLAAEAAGTRGRLAAVSGAPFDRAYVDAQVRVHAQVLELIDRVLVPATMRVELRAALMDDVRPMVAAHLQQARDLQAAVGAP